VPPLATNLFDYVLPPHLIAQTPAARRDQSRLLVVDRSSHTVTHGSFSDLPKFLRSGDVLIRNNAAVLPARLHARRPSGGQVECFLLRPADTDPETWRCLIKPGKKLPVGATFAAADFGGTVVEKFPDGSALVRFTTTRAETIVDVANRVGEIPLPPYITRSPADLSSDAVTLNDRERYQTVYADAARQVAVAAPTAGLHFTPELLATLVERGVSFSDLTLHVGLGTFKPITAEAIESHEIHREIYEIPATTQQILLSPPPGRRIAVGTTAVRSIEDFLSRDPGLPPLLSAPSFAGEASIFIYPPRPFKGVDALITNFHQPRSTLLCLVSAFLTPGTTNGIAWLHEIYADAIRREYRFFSYGDAMLIL
jgi:S-adenosylmethionine:tRNA ribosyltransferase-isomerase